MGETAKRSKAAVATAAHVFSEGVEDVAWLTMRNFNALRLMPPTLIDRSASV